MSALRHVTFIVASAVSLLTDRRACARLIIPRPLAGLPPSGPAKRGQDVMAFVNFDSEGLQRVANSIGQGTRNRAWNSFAQTATAKRRVRTWSAGFVMHLDRRNVRSGRKLIVLESARELLPVVVVDELLEETIRYSLYDTALDLRFYNLGIDDCADVLRSDISRQLDLI